MQLIDACFLLIFPGRKIYGPILYCNHYHRHINDQVRNHYEKIRDDLKKELHEELAKKGLPNKLEHLAPVEIEGTMRKQLGRPILSDVQRMLS